MFNFNTPKEMYDCINDGTDLYNLDTRQYVFSCSDLGSIAVYIISRREARQLVFKNSEDMISWSCDLGRGGTIYDTVEAKRELCDTPYEPNVDDAMAFCEENFLKGIWINADDYANITQTQKVIYEIFKANWLMTHITPEILKNTMIRYGEYCLDEATYVPFDQYLEEQGYDSDVIYPCIEEFLTSEYYDRNFVKSLLPNEEWQLKYLRELRDFDDYFAY